MTTEKDFEKAASILKVLLGEFYPEKVVIKMFLNEGRFDDLKKNTALKWRAVWEDFDQDDSDKEEHEEHEKDYLENATRLDLCAYPDWYLQVLRCENPKQDGAE